MEELTGAERDRARLAAAVAVLSRHIDAGGELPPGQPHSCYACPVAVYLTEKVGKDVGVACDIAWIAFDEEDDISSQVTLPKNVAAWVWRFDTAEEDSWT